ncbi:hypothetical protein Tco_1354342 [Tanacetum coccineum]
MNIWVSLASPELTPSTKLMNPDLTCPLTYQLLQSFPDCSGPNTSFDMLASPEYLSSLARASLAKDAIGSFHSAGSFGFEEGYYFQSALSVFADRADDDVVSSLSDSVKTRGLSGFFLIDRKAIPDYMTWRHPKSAIYDPKPVAGSYRMVGVRHLSAHVVKLRDMPVWVLVLSGLSRV